MKKKYRSLSIFVFTFIVILVTAASNIILLTIKQQQTQASTQLMLLANHNVVNQYLTNTSPENLELLNTELQFLLDQQDAQVEILVWVEMSGLGDGIVWLGKDKKDFYSMDFTDDLLLQIEAIDVNATQWAGPISIKDKQYQSLLLRDEVTNQPSLLLMTLDQGLAGMSAKFVFWFLLIIMAISALSYCAFSWFYTLQKAKWLDLIHKAKIDRLTGLPNQQQLLKDLEHSEHTNLAFIKFHNFNSILYTYGPAITDGVIKQISAVISGFEHPLLVKSACYHVNQSVFAILEDQDINLQGITEITKSLVSTIMTTQYQVGEGEYISVNVTTGAVRQNTDAFMLANMALQEAESKKLQFYLIDKHNSMLPETYKRDLALTQVLLKGIKEHRVVAYFQPIFSAKSLQVKKYECLARLIDDEGQVLLMPNVFIPLAHRANLYYLITKVMIKHAVDFADRSDVVVTLNLSVTDIYNKRTCDYLFHKIKKSGIGHLLQFELLENEAIIESDEIIAFINKLKSYGCKVGMDDLGKGHSNIERLLNLPVDFVKIDRSIMENVTQNLEMQNVARGIVKLAHKKGYEVVAEYCASQTLVNIAIDLGVDYLQGFHLGKPAKGLFVDETIKATKAINKC